MLREGIRGQTHWNHNHRKLVNLITQTTALSNSMKLSHALWGHPRQSGHVERSEGMWFTGEGNGKPLQYFSVRTPWTVWKGKMIGYWRRNSPCRLVPNMLLEISGEITPERIKGWSQSKNNTQLWMWLMIDVKSDTVKSNIAQEPGMSGPWIKGSGQTGDGKSERRYSRNQRTKMCWNGWI